MHGQFLSKIMFTGVVTLKPDDTVERGLELLKKNNLRVLPVVGQDGVFIGMFGIQEIFEHVVPLAGIYAESLGFAVGAAPDIAARLREFFPLRAEEFTERNVFRLKPETHTWEALRALVKYGSPLAVVEQDTGRFVGLISEQSAMEALLSIQKQS